jgi:hypothetical protein
MNHPSSPPSYRVVTIPPFDKQLKRLVKKYPSLKTEYLQLIDSLEVNPNMGISLGNNCFKIKIGIESKGQGKSGGARVITHVQVFENMVFLLSIFDKSDQENISDKDLDGLLSMLP